jgi:regulator of RNase E activity RraA
MGKTVAEHIEYLKTCETGYVTDALNLLAISHCWLEGISSVKTSATKMVGEAYTSKMILLREAELPLSLYHVVDQCPQGHVLVASNINDLLLVGINVMTRASNKGIAGVVVEAKNRDADELRELPMPVFSQGVGVRIPPVPMKIHYETQIPIDICGAKIYQGDIIMGDSDGVVVIPRSKIDEVIYQVEMIKEVEREIAQANRDHPDMPVDEFLKILAKKKVPRKAENK